MKTILRNTVLLLIVLFFLSPVYTYAYKTSYTKKKMVLVKKIIKTVLDGNKKRPMLNKKFVQFDRRGLFVYKLKKKNAYKTYLNYKKKSKNTLIIYKGLKKGDLIVTAVLVKLNNKIIKGRFISKSLKTPVKIMSFNRHTGKYITKKTYKKKNIVLENLEVEITMGTASKNEFDDLYLKDNSYEGLLKQYSNLNNISYNSVSDTSTPFGTFKPINININYKIFENLYIIGGFEFSSTSSSSTKSFDVIWPEFKNTYGYDFTHEISYFSPYIGVGKNFDNFGIYANIGLNSISYNYTMSKNFSEQKYWEKVTETIEGTASRLRLTLGLKYKQLITGRLHGLIRVEYSMSGTPSIDANLSQTASNSEGKTTSNSDSGLIYKLNINPYSLNEIKTWGVFKTPPKTSWMSNFTELTLPMSTFKISIGLSY